METWKEDFYELRHLCEDGIPNHWMHELALTLIHTHYDMEVS